MSVLDSKNCSECGGDLINSDGEKICDECGLVVNNINIDRGPDWRDFGDENKKRTGSALSESLHDRGLSTTIGKKVDGNGNYIDPKKKRHVSRLRKWNNRCLTQDSREKNFLKAFAEIKRMSSALGIPKATADRACNIYRHAHKEDLLIGRSIEGASSACLFIVCKIEDMPRTPREITEVSRVGKLEIMRTKKHIVSELSLTIKPTDPREYLGRFISNLVKQNENLTRDDLREIEKTSRYLIEETKGKNTGKAPSSLAAGAIYAASIMEGDKIFQHKIAEASGKSTVTVRNRYKDIIEVYNFD